MLILTKHAQQNIVRDHLDLAWIEAAITRPHTRAATPRMQPSRAFGAASPSGVAVPCELSFVRPALIS